MKHSPKTQPEPEGLQKYRNANPQATWDDFKDEAQDEYAALKAQLLADQRGLCAYCELQVSETNRQVAHFHPKSDTADAAPNWGLMWSNLWLCCRGGTQPWLANNPETYLPPLPANRSCDESKTDEIVDGLVLAPSQVPAMPCLFLYQQKLDGVEITPHPDLCAQAGIEIEIVERTIEKFNLNCPRLYRARLEALKVLNRDIQASRSRGLRTTPPAKWLSPTAKGYRPFFTLYRSMLGDAAEEYLIQQNYNG